MTLQKILDLNKISAEDKANFVRRGIIRDDVSPDENMLRLKGYYSQSAMYQSHIKLYMPDFERRDTKQIISFFTDDMIASDLGIAETYYVSLYNLRAALNKVGAVPIPVPILYKSNLFKNAFTKHTFYIGNHIREALNLIHASNKVISVRPTNYSKCLDKFLKGQTMKHPDGVAGNERLQQLYLSECRKIVNECVTKFDFPVFGKKAEQTIKPKEPTLTYETIDYDKLDLRQVYKKKNFKQFLTLCNCADKDHLIDFLMGDGSDTSLAVLAKKVSKLPTAQQVYNNVTSQQPVSTTQQPTKTLTIAEKKQKFKALGDKYFTRPQHPSAYDNKTLTQMFNMETATARAKYKALTGDDGIDSDYYDMMINVCRTDEYATTAQKKIEYVTMHGLIPSDIREEDYDQFTEDYLNSEVERVLPIIQTSFSLWHYYCKNIDKDTLKDESRRAENVQLFLEACDDIRDSDYVNSYVTMPDILAMLNVHPSDQIRYKDKLVSIKSLLALTYNIPEDKILNWSSTGYDNICKYVKIITDFIIASLAAEKARRDEEKLVAAKDSLNLLTLPLYQNLLDSYRESPDDRPWVDNDGKYFPKVRADYEISRCLDEISEIGDPAEAARLNELSYILETFKAELITGDNLPTTDDEYLEQVRAHMVAVG